MKMAKNEIISGETFTPTTLKSQFNYDLNQNSPVIPGFDRVVSYDEEGAEIISYVETDYPALSKQYGSADNWSLDALLKAGVNPNFSIHTGNVSRIESETGVQAMLQDVVNYYAEQSQNETNEK